MIGRIIRPRNCAATVGSASTDVVYENSWVVENRSRPPTPEQNGMTERFFRSQAEECVWQQNFADVQEAETAISGWIRWYNERRAHQALGYLSPHQYRASRLAVRPALSLDVKIDREEHERPEQDGDERREDWLDSVEVREVVM
jgi:Integrase core domain